MKLTSALLAAGLLFQGIASGQTDIRLSGGFTQRVANENGGNNNNLRSKVNSGIGNTNGAMNSSQTNSRISLGWFAIFPRYNDSGKNVGSALGDWRRRRSVIGRTGAGETQLRLQDRTRADLMMLVISSRSRGNNGEATPDTGFSCIKGNRERNPTFPHEIGHNISALHSHANTMRRSSRNQLTKDTTTLVGSRGRPFLKDGGSIVNRFSNPNLRYRGATTGRRGSNENAQRISRARINRSRIR